MKSERTLKIYEAFNKSVGSYSDMQSEDEEEFKLTVLRYLIELDERICDIEQYIENAETDKKSIIKKILTLGMKSY